MAKAAAATTAAKVGGKTEAKAGVRDIAAAPEEAAVATVVAEAEGNAAAAVAREEAYVDAAGWTRGEVRMCVEWEGGDG